MKFPYPVLCSVEGCDHLALFKIAARWSDGVTGELKTYDLCCEECLPVCLRRSQEKQEVCHLAPGETLDRPGIYRLQRGKRDQKLERLEDLEQSLSK